VTYVTIEMLLEMANSRYDEGIHLADIVMADVESGDSAYRIRTDAVTRGAYLTAYFADCVLRLQQPNLT